MLSRNLLEERSTSERIITHGIRTVRRLCEIVVRDELLINLITNPCARETVSLKLDALTQRGPPALSPALASLLIVSFVG